LLDQEPALIELGCHIRSFPLRLRIRTPLLSPFALCTALPCSDYYGDSVPRPGRHWTWQLAKLRGPGARVEVPVFQGGTLGALGGRLYPWQRGPLPRRGSGSGASACGCTQSPHLKATRLRLHWLVEDEVAFRTEASSTNFMFFTMTPAVNPPLTPARLRGQSSRSALAGRRSNLGDVHGPFFIRPDPDEDACLFRSSVSPSISRRTSDEAEDTAASPRRSPVRRA
jgi:hypothetical protein